MITSLMPVPKQQYFAVAGIPLVGGKIYTYAAGTSTPKATYSDSDGTVAQANPIPLNSRGEPANAIYWSGSYKVVIKDALGNTVYTVDNYNTDPAGVWSTAATYLTAIGSSLIGFIQAGVGAVLQTLQTKVRQLEVSPRDFGAVGDGVTDDTAAITKAINTGRAVAFRDGTFLISGPISPRSRTKWLGDMTGTIKYSSKTSLIDVQMVSDWMMSGVIVDGNYTNYTVNDGQDIPWGVRLEQCDNCEVSGNHFKNLYRIGIAVGHISAVPCTAIRVHDNLIENIGRAVDPIVGFGNGIAIICADGVSVKNNRIRNITGNTTATGGINLEPALATHACTNIEIAGNNISGINNASGIQCYESFVPTASLDNINIHDNIVNGTGTGYGISVDNFGVSDVHHNILTSTQGINANRMSLTDISIDENTISGTSVKSGITVRAARTLSVCRNRLRNIAGVGIDIGVDTGGDNNVKMATVIGNELHTIGLDGISAHLYNFSITGNTLINCGTASTGAYYLRNFPATAASLNGIIAGNNFVHYGANTVAGFIDAEGGAYDQTVFGENTFSGTPAGYNTFNIAGRCPGVYLDILPAAGTWQVGDKVYKRTPIAGGNIGWVITTAPLTWKAFGTIAA